MYKLNPLLSQTLARLGPGSVFGGGPAILGDGPIQSCLRVVASSDLELYHIHAEVFCQHAGEALIRWVVICMEACMRMHGAHGASDLELYHAHAEVFCQHAGETLIRCVCVRRNWRVHTLAWSACMECMHENLEPGVAAAYTFHTHSQDTA